MYDRTHERIPSWQVLRDRSIEVYDSLDPILEASLRRAVDLWDLDHRRHVANHLRDCDAAVHARAVYAALHDSRPAYLIDADISRRLLASLLAITADCAITEPSCSRRHNPSRMR